MLREIELKKRSLIALAAVMMVNTVGAVTINNHSFELSAANHYDGDPGEWSSVMSGIKYAATAEEFKSAAPDGSHVIFAHTSNHRTYQVLTETLAAYTTYTLQMDIVRRGDKEKPIKSMLALGYGKGGLKGGTELARIVSGGAGAPIPKTPGQKATWTLSFKTGASPAGLGEVLWIALGAEGSINDGSNGYDNIRLGAKQALPDTDGDGLPDAFELLHTTPPSKTAMKAGDDIEPDGLTNIKEYRHGTDPKNRDTDSDKLTDGDEVAGTQSRPQTNPLSADTDGDGLDDSVESNTGIWVSKSDRGTNPTHRDTDLDGLTDDTETNTGSHVSKTNTGTNPLVADSDADGAGDWYEVAVAYTNPFDAKDLPIIPYPLPAPDGSAGATNKPVKVYIMSGQSNMVGFGQVSGADPGSLETITTRENKFPNLRDSSDNWTVRKDVMYRGVISCIGNDHLKPGFGARATVCGPELGFGHVMGYYHDEPVLLIKSSIGNRSLSWDYAGPSTAQFEYKGNIYAGYGETPNSWLKGTKPVSNGWYAGYQYDQCFLDEADMAGTVPIKAFNVVDVLDNFATEYPQYAAQGFEIAGYVWWQGHKDQSDPHASRYEQNMANFIKDLRSYYEKRYPTNTSPNSPVVLATAAFDGGWDNKQVPFLNIVKGQLAVSDPAKHPEFNGNVKTVEARGYWRDSSASPTAVGYHYNYNAETYMLVGDALGRAMVELQGSETTK